MIGFSLRLSPPPPNRLRLRGAGPGGFCCSVQTVPLHTAEHSREAGAFHVPTTTLTTSGYPIRLPARLRTDPVAWAAATAGRLGASYAPAESTAEADLVF